MPARPALRRPLSRAQAADVEAVAPRIWRLVFAVYGNGPWQDDVFQSAMEAVCRSRHRWNPGGGASFSTYAINRAKGAIIDYLRDQHPGTRNHPARTPLSLDEFLTDEDGATLHAMLAYDDPEPPDELLERQVQREVDQLSPRAQAALRLYAADLTMHEVGEVMGISESRVSQLLSEARRRLAPRLASLDLSPSAMAA